MIQIVTVGSQIYSSLSLLARQSMLMLTELPEMVSVLELRAAILQNYLLGGRRGRFGRKRENVSRPPPPTDIIPDTRPLSTFENQDGRH